MVGCAEAGEYWLWAPEGECPEVPAGGLGDRLWDGRCEPGGACIAPLSVAAPFLEFNEPTKRGLLSLGTRLSSG